MRDETSVISSPAQTAGPLEEDVTTTLYRAAIGPVRTDYYLRHFTRLEAADRSSPSWNWAASLCTLNWLLYRKLWLHALGYAGAMVALALLVFGIGPLVLQFSDTSELAMLGVFAALAFVLPGAYGNVLYYRDCRKKMATALAANAELPQACAMLSGAASTSRRLLWQAVTNAVLLGLAGGAYLGFMEFSAPAPTVASTSASTASGPIAGLPSASSSEPQPVAPAPVTVTAASTPALPSASAALAPVASASAPTAASPAAAASQSAQAVATDPALASPAQTAKPPSHSAPAAHSKSTKPTVPSAKSVAKVHSYYVNVGLFAVPTNAANAHAKLLAAGLPSHTKVLKTAKGPLTRVRVGPFETRKQAQAAVDTIQTLQLDAFIVEP